MSGGMLEDFSLSLSRFLVREEDSSVSEKYNAAASQPSFPCCNTYFYPAPDLYHDHHHLPIVSYVFSCPPYLMVPCHRSIN